MEDNVLILPYRVEIRVILKNQYPNVLSMKDPKISCFLLKSWLKASLWSILHYNSFSMFRIFLFMKYWSLCNIFFLRSHTFGIITDSLTYIYTHMHTTEKLLVQLRRQFYLFIYIIYSIIFLYMEYYVCSMAWDHSLSW